VLNLFSSMNCLRYPVRKEVRESFQGAVHSVSSFYLRVKLLDADFSGHDVFACCRAGTRRLLSLFRRDNPETKPREANKPGRSRTHGSIVATRGCAS